MGRLLWDDTRLVRDDTRFNLNKVRPFDLKSFFYDEDIEFLVRNNGDQVHVSNLEGKIVGLYFFSPLPRQWRSRQFNTILVEIYNELASMGEDFEIVTICDDYRYKKEFDECFSKMPWLAIPFFEPEAIDYRFEIWWLPRLIIFDANGMIVTKEGSELLWEYGIEAYPFTPIKLKQLMEKEQQQPLIQRILGTTSCDFLIASDGSKVPVSVLEGKIIGMYYSCCKLELQLDHHGTISLRNVYSKLKERGENFEIVLVCLDDDEMSFDRCFKGMPWLAIPFAFKGNLCRRLHWDIDYYRRAKDNGVLHMIDTDGRTLNKDARSAATTGDMEEFPFLEMTTLDIRSLEFLLGREERDYVIKNDGTMVKLSNLEWKVVAFYWSASHIPESGTHTQKLVDAYHELRSKRTDFEIVYISYEKDEESFNGYFSQMPWLAIPYLDVGMRVDLKKFIIGKQIPQLMIRDRSGNLLPEDAFWALRNSDSKACQFIEEEEEESIQSLSAAYSSSSLISKGQFIQSLLRTHSRDFLISNKGVKVPISELQGKTIGLYFSGHSLQSRGFAEMLKEVYENLKKRGEKFEIVEVFVDSNISLFDSTFATMPWLAIPFNDASCWGLSSYFNGMGTPLLVIVGSDGMTLNPNANELVEEYGDEAFPFSHEKIEELAEKYKPNTKPETLLVSWQRDYLIGKGDSKIPVSELAGKAILLYFGGKDFLDYYRPKLREIYFKLKEREYAFEVIFVWVSREGICDGELDKKLFADSFSVMPWLALPCEDPRIDILLRKFNKSRWEDYFVAIPSSGRGLTKGRRLQYLIMTFEADAYPFTRNQLRVLEKRDEELRKKIDEMVQKMPERIKHPHHAEHHIVKHESGGGFFFCRWCKRLDYGRCFGCDQSGCKGFSLHIKCAIESMKMEGWAVDVGGEEVVRLFDEDACSTFGV